MNITQSSVVIPTDEGYAVAEPSITLPDNLFYPPVASRG